MVKSFSVLNTFFQYAVSDYNNEYFMKIIINIFKLLFIYCFIKL